MAHQVYENGNQNIPPARSGWQKETTHRSSSEDSYKNPYNLQAAEILRTSLWSHSTDSDIAGIPPCAPPPSNQQGWENGDQRWSKRWSTHSQPQRQPRTRSAHGHMQAQAVPWRAVHNQYTLLAWAGRRTNPTQSSQVIEGSSTQQLRQRVIGSQEGKDKRQVKNNFRKRLSLSETPRKDVS